MWFKTDLNQQIQIESGRFWAVRTQEMHQKFYPKKFKKKS